VVLAHLKSRETRDRPEERRTWKVRLVKSLFDRGLTAEEIRQLFRVIDWLLELPHELERQFQEEIHRFEEERPMPYVRPGLGRTRARFDVCALWPVSAPHCGRSSAGRRGKTIGRVAAGKMAFRSQDWRWSNL